MGLIKALTSSTSSALGDQFKEFVTCPTIEKNVLIQRGTVEHGKGNKNPSEGVISNGSAIVVPQGMAMMIIDNGAITEFSSEPGTYTYDSSSEPSIFTEGLGKGIVDTIKTIGKRITYGGQTAKDQRVYYVNLLTITGNKFGSPQPRKITDDKYGMIEVTFYGEYAFKVTDPALLVQNIIGANPKDTVTYDEVVGSQLKGKFIEKISEAISKVMRLHHVSFGDILMYNSDITDQMNQVLDESWKKQYGLEITDVALADINLTEESMARVNKVDEATIFSDGKMQSGLMANATAEAMQNASENSNGAMMGFMGMNMATQAGTTVMGAVNQNQMAEGPNFTTNNTPTPGTLFKNPEEQKEEVTEEKEEPKEEPQPAPKEETPNQTTVFCPNCGKESSITANFCTQCGQKLKDN